MVRILVANNDLFGSSVAFVSNIVLQVFHSDYFSGWDVNELQTVLDNCENYSDAAMPDAFCSDWLTFKGHGKEEGVQYPDEDIVEGLQETQPDPIDTQV